MYLERSASARFRELMTVFPAVVVTGARQVGKSTLIRHLLGKTADIVVLDPATDPFGARADADLFLGSRGRPLVLDEIQFSPNLVPALKRWIDQDRRPGQYVLTGSGQWGVMRTITESLAGRCVFLDLEGFSLAEIAGRPGESWLGAILGDSENTRGVEPHGIDYLRSRPSRLPPIETRPVAVAVAVDRSDREPARTRSPFEQIFRGFLPEAQFLPIRNLRDFHSAYVRTYIERDIRHFADVSDLALFGRFVQLLAALTAQEINRSELGRDLGVHSTTAARWINLLEAMFQWHEIPPFSRNATKRLSRRPKGYFGDTGLACTLQAIGSPADLGGHPLLGPLFETAVVAEIRRMAAHLTPRPNLYHWRSHGGAEVDLIVESNGTLYPIEIKAKSRPDHRDASGLHAFRETYPRLRFGPGLIVAPAESVYPVTERDWVVPWDAAGPI